MVPGLPPVDGQPCCAPVLHVMPHALHVHMWQMSHHAQAVVTLKHFDAQTVENSDGWNRHNISANVSKYAPNSCQIHLSF